MNLTNKIVRAYLLRYKKILDKLRFKAIELQEKELKKILRSPVSQAKKITSYHSFKTLPITYYSDYASAINDQIHSKSFLPGSVKYFAKSAGTSEKGSKYIPTTSAYLYRNHVQGSWLTLALLNFIRPDMDVFSRKNLLVGGAIYEKKNNHIIGDISGLMIQNIPKQFHKYYVPTIAEATQTNWESKLHITADKASQDAEIVLFAGVPTWILTLSKEILKRAEKETLLEVWPQVKAYLHGGVNFDPYRAQFEELLPDKNFLYLEVYNASEGFIAVQDTRENNGLLLLTGHGIYYEFISKDDYNNGDINILNLEEIELNEEYVLLISNISGLYRYVIGDIISFVSKVPFRVQVKGRISDYVNAFGEDLTLEMVNKALTSTLENHNSSIRNYTVAPSYISLNKKGKHQWFIEFEKEPLNLSIFQKDLDEELQSSNFNYYQKRIHNLAMEELEIISLRKDFFDDMAKNLGKFGGQNKLPKLRNDRKLAELILKENKTFKLEEKSDARIYT